MNYKMIGRINALIMCIEALFMLPALFISLGYREPGAAKAFAVSILITAACAGVLMLVCRKAQMKFYAREGLVCVGLAWAVISLFGCLPLYLSHEFPKFIDALFETASGFTTTGASVCSDVEALSHGILYWRSFTHWLGGMGVLVFALAIVPISGKSNGFSLHILRAESPGPDVGKSMPKMRQTAAVTYIMYIALTVLNFITLLIGKMSVFEALCTAIGTAGTGGFGLRNDSIASCSPFIQNTCTVFMLLFGVNFACYLSLIRRQIMPVLKDEELHFYLGEFAVATGIFVLSTRHLYPSLGEGIRYGAFTAASLMTTTGFAVTDFDKWPTISKAVILFLMMGGACIGSTGGGLKTGRLMLLFKSIHRNINKYLHPERVQSVRLNKKPVDEEVLTNTSIYFTVYAMLLIFSFLIVSLDGFSVSTGISSVVSCVNNIGPGFETCGPMANYAPFGVLSKIVLIIDMLAGRLELFPILVLFSKSTWKRV